MIARHTIIRVQTLSKSEYNRSKHIPSANPSKRVTFGSGEGPLSIDPTPLPIMTSSLEMRDERDFRQSLPGAGEQIEVQKRTHRIKGLDTTPPGNESYLAKELQIQNDELEELRAQVQHLRSENNQLRQEREYIIKDFEQRDGNSKERFEYERMINALENENKRLNQEINQIKYTKTTMEDDLHLSRAQIRENEELRNTINEVLSERDHLEMQLKQAKSIQISLEQELRQKADERNKLFSDYEVRITTLQNEIASLRSQKQGDTLRRSQMVGKLQDENSTLANDLYRLKQEKAELEIQIENLRKDKLGVDGNTKLRLAELEASNNSFINLLDQERRSSQSLRNLLQQKEKELNVKETELSNLLQQKNYEVIDLRAKLERPANGAEFIVLYMAEIERLQNILDSKKFQIESLHDHYKQEIEHVRIATEVKIKDSLKSEIFQLGNQLQAERTQTQIELGNLRRKIVDYEARIAILSSDLEKANRKVIEVQSPNYINSYFPEKELSWEDSRRQSEVEKRAGHGILNAASPVKAIFGQSNSDVIIGDLNQRIMELESKSVLYMAEIERLGNLIIQLQQEKDILAKSSAQQGIYESQNRYEADKFAYELQLQGYKARIEDLENKVSFLKDENENLQQINLEKIAELDDWKLRYNYLERSQDQGSSESQINQMNLKISDLENQVMSLTGEKYQLSQAIETKESELSDLINKLAETEQKYQMIISNMEVSFNHRLLIKKENELMGNNNQLISEKNTLETELKTKSARLIYLEEQFTNASNELHRLKQEDLDKTLKIDELNAKIKLLDEYKTEIDTWKQKYNELQIYHAHDLENVKSHLEEAIRQDIIREFEAKFSEWGSDKKMLEDRFNIVYNQKEDLENKIILLGAEMTRLEQVIESLTAEKNIIQDRNQELEQNLTLQQINLEAQLKKAIEKEMLEINSRLLNERSSFENEIIRQKLLTQDVQMRNVLYIAEIERLGQIILNREIERDTLKKQYEDLHLNQTSVMFHKDLEIREQNQRWQYEKKALEAEINNLSIRNREIEDTLHLLREENFKLQEKLNLANTQLDQQRTNLNDIHVKNSIYIEELKSQIRIQLKNEFESQTREMAEKFGFEKNGFESQIRKLKERIVELEVQLQDMERQNSKLMIKAEEQLHELEFMRTKYGELEKNSANSLKDITEKLEYQRNQEINEIVKKSSSQYQSEKMILESQIRAANERIQALETKAVLLSAENERLSDVYSKKAIEFEELRDVVNRTNSQYFLEKSTYESSYNSLNDRLRNYERQITSLNDEVNNLKRINGITISELEEYKRKNETFEGMQIQLDQLKLQLEMKYRKEKDDLQAYLRQTNEQEKYEYENALRKAQQDVIESEKRMRIAEVEAERLALQIKSKNEEIKEFRDKIIFIENQKNQEIARQREIYDIERKDLENKLLSDKFEGERVQYNAKIKELKQKINELENRNTYITVELEKQNSLYKNKTKEVESWREKYNKLENSRFLEIDEVKSQVELLKRSSLQLSDYEVRFKAERAAYEAQILQFKQTIEELETKIQEITVENERISTLYAEKTKEIENLRTRQGRPDVNSQKELDSLRKENEALKREKFDFNAAKVKFDVERKTFENEITQLQQALNAKKIEIAKLYDLIDTRRAESENLAQELLEAREEIAKTSKYCKELEAEYLELNSKYDQVMKDVGESQRSRELYRSQIDQAQRELAKKNRELIQKIHEVDSLKAKYEEACAAMEPIGTVTSKVITRVSATEYPR